MMILQRLSLIELTHDDDDNPKRYFVSIVIIETKADHFSTISHDHTGISGVENPVRRWIS